MNEPQYEISGKVVTYYYLPHATLMIVQNGYGKLETVNLIELE